MTSHIQLLISNFQRLNPSLRGNGACRRNLFRSQLESGFPLAGLLSCTMRQFSKTQASVLVSVLVFDD
jgi:hypothetical protein